MTTVDELDEIRRRLEAEENRGEVDAMLDVLAEDVAIMVPDHEVQEGRAAATEFLRDVTAWMRENLNRHITYTSHETRVVGEVALDRGGFAFTVALKSGGETEHVTGKYLWMYRRVGSDWKLWRAIMSVDEDEPEPHHSG